MRNFVVTVKERQRDEPCYLLFELHEEIGLSNNQHITLDLPSGTNIDDAQRLAGILNAMDVKLSVKKF